MSLAGRGDIFGLSVDDLTSVVKSNYNVHALTFCDMNKIDAYDLQDIFDMYPEFTEIFKRKFSLTFNLKMVSKLLVWFIKDHICYSVLLYCMQGNIF